MFNGPWPENVCRDAPHPDLNADPAKNLVVFVDPAWIQIRYPDLAESHMRGSKLSGSSGPRNVCARLMCQTKINVRAKTCGVSLHVQAVRGHPHPSSRPLCPGESFDAASCPVELHSVNQSISRALPNIIRTSFYN